ncbi:cellulase family glycosylhydrolase [Mycolicibacter minnesotensis]
MTAHRTRILGSALGICVALPLALAPSARADLFDTDWFTELVAPLSTVADPIGSDPGAAAAGAIDPDVFFDQYLYTPLHGLVDHWINSDLGRQLDALINAPVGLLTGRALIGDGAAGTADSPDGGDGGWLFGDGGAGWNSTESGVSGGSGGAAGLFGTGGAGGDGGAGAAGGDGGTGGWLFGRGGDGGDAGDGAGAWGMPALGGAGGTPGMVGLHGAVGKFGTLESGPPTSTAGLSTTGSWFTDSDGKVAILHGFNQIYKIPPFEPGANGFDDDDAAFLAANGFNAVRLGVLWAGVEPQPGVFDQAYLDAVSRTVETLGRHGIVSIIDLHQDNYSGLFPDYGNGAPDWATLTGGLSNPKLDQAFTYLFNPAQNHAWDAFWWNKPASDGIGLQNHYAQMFEFVANHFKDDANVAGYEIMNEPWQGSTWLSSVFGNSHFDSQFMTPFYNQVASAIRAVDPTTPALFEPSALFNEMIPTKLGPIDDPHAVFAFHEYCPLPNAAFDCASLSEVIFNNARAYIDTYGVPAMLTEFGSANSLINHANSMDAADRLRIGWSDWTYSDPCLGCSLVFDPSRPPIGDNLDLGKLDVMAVPYPELVAGTPTSWSYDAATGTFNLAYSTLRADGTGSFEAGALTTIAMPGGRYPEGFAVTVTGGYVVPGTDPGAVVIASNAGAGTVSVVIGPGR